MGVYIYPVDSRNYKLTDYGSVVDDINYWLNKGYLPFIAGDFNSRIRDLNTISEKSLKWRYAGNVDDIKNPHGLLFSDMCELLKILPINHCFFHGKYFKGGYTYFKSNRKSQIDFLITNNIGRAKINDFQIIEKGSHFSDHLPIDLKFNFEFKVDVHALFMRAKLLQEKFILTTTPLTTFRNKFNFVEATRMLSENAYSILNECETCSSHEIVDIIYKNIDCTLKKTKIAEHMNLRNTRRNIMEECDSAFCDYLVWLRTQNSSPNEIKEAYSTYQSKRCLLNKDLALKHQNEY